MSKGLFSRLPSAAVFDHRLKAGPLRVLAALGVYADPLGNCHPSIVTIARRLNLTRRMVQLHLRTLEEAGYLLTATRARVIAGKGINSYHLQYPEPPDDAKLDFASEQGGEANPDFASDATEPETVTRNPAHGDAKFFGGDAKSNVTVTRNPASHKQPNELSHLEQPKNSPGSFQVKNVSGGDCTPGSQPGQPRPPLRGQDVLKRDEFMGGRARIIGETSVSDRVQRFVDYLVPRLAKMDHPNGFKSTEHRERALAATLAVLRTVSDSDILELGRETKVPDEMLKAWFSRYRFNEDPLGGTGNGEAAR